MTSRLRTSSPGIFAATLAASIVAVVAAEAQPQDDARALPAQLPATPAVSGMASIPPEKRTSGISDRIKIDAPPSLVWSAIHEERDQAPGLAYSRLLSENGNQSQVEQKFEFIPFVKTSTQVIDFSETPITQIDFSSIIDDVHVAGCWRLEAAEDGQSTVLSLSTYSDSHMAHMLGKPFVKLWIHRRLADVKKYAMRERLLHVDGRVIHPENAS